VTHRLAVGRLPGRMLAALARLLPALVALTLLASCGGGSGGSGSSGSSGSSGGSGAGATPMTASTAAERFLSTYVRADGAVLRKDQQGDVVSEGQAYAMLIAEVAGREDLTRTIWSWTKQHLQRPDGLLSWNAAADGTVRDPSSASDADILAAYALLRYDGPQATPLHQDGQRLAAAVLTHESASTSRGPVPLGGPWAMGADRPKVDPSYWMPGIFAGLARMTGDQRWAQAATATVALVDRASGGGKDLPPDWALLDADGYTPTGGAGNGIQYGADAQRLPLWFGYGCSKTAQGIAARWWDRLGQDSGALTRSLTGAVSNGERSVVALLGAAAAAAAAGDDDAAARLRAEAATTAQASPTYFGDAWLALSAGLADGRFGC
jgi:endoglucanase